MTSINQQVWQALQQDPAILKNMQRKLINTRALAKYLIKSYNLPASLDSVISSIRRFPLNDHKEEQNVLLNIFKNSMISTTNNVACITIPLLLAQALPKLVGIPMLRLTTGVDKIKVIVENKHVGDITKQFKNAQAQTNLSEISVTVAEKAVTTKGVLARITGELSTANINIAEILVCPPQFLIYVSEKDTVKAHERVLSLTVG